MARHTPDIPAVLADILDRLDKLDRRTRLAVSALQNLETTMSAAMDRLRAAVTEQSTVTQGVVMLLHDLNTRLKQAIDDEDDEALLAVSADLEKNTAALAQAVTANTPVAGEPDPVLGDPAKPADAPAEGGVSGGSEPKPDPSA